MKKAFWIILFLNFSQLIFAQKKEIEYVDKDWQQTTKDSASFYKVGIAKGGYYIGAIEIYYISGKLWGKAFYTDDHVLEGSFISFYENGDTMEKGYYKNDLFYLINYWDKNKIKAVKNGNGFIATYYPNGKIQELREYQDEIPSGENKFYDSTGILIGHYHYVKDTLADSSIVTIQEIITYKNIHTNESLITNGNGSYTKYYKNGKIEEQGIYLSKRRNGVWTSYYSHGIISSKGKYKNGLKVGRWTHRYNNGKLMKVENYKEGSLDGYKFLYNLNGKLTTRETYSNGIKTSEIQFDN